MFCQQLDLKRGKQPQIAAALAKGNADAIIDDFFHRCDKPKAVQRLIENELVTKSGYRYDMDLDEAKRKLERDGVPGSLIDELVNERVLHIEEH